MAAAPLYETYIVLRNLLGYASHAVDCNLQSAKKERLGCDCGAEAVMSHARDLLKALKEQRETVGEHGGAVSGDPAVGFPATNSFAIVELMGHDSIAGRVSHVHGMVRVDVPELPEEPEKIEPAAQFYKTGEYHTPVVPARPAYTKFFGPGAIFSIRLCAEQEAIDHESDRRYRPSRTFVPDPTQIPAPRPSSAADDDLEEDADFPNPFDPEGI